MNPRKAQDLAALAEAYVAGDLSPKDLAALEAHLRGSEAARLSFLAYLEVHAGLAWEHRGAEPGRTQSLRGETPSVHAPRTSAVALALVAAVIALCALVRLWLPAGAPAGHAVVKASLDAVSSSGESVSVGAALPSGVWELRSGLVELETTSGAVLLVEAPAHLELLNPLHARLIQGNTVVRMPKGKSGFVMDLPRMRVTDLGTEFGVSAALDGESRVQVFAGRVSAEFLSMPGNRELSVGESLVCKTDGIFTSGLFRENLFVRHLPPRAPSHSPGGLVYNHSTVDAVRIVPPSHPVVIDADLAEWNPTYAIRSACVPPYGENHFLEAMMMYDAQHLYIGAHVGDPEPMRNTAEDAMEFAGGSVIVRVSTDRNLGWPLKGMMSNARSRDPKKPAAPDSLSDRVVSMILSHDARSGTPRLQLQYGFHFRGGEDSPAGWRGAFRRDPDGRGYTLEYAIPWALLHCEADPPHAGDALAALWMVHWSDGDGRLCRGQLVDVTNPQTRTNQGYPPATFYQNGVTWGRALYLGKN